MPKEDSHTSDGRVHEQRNGNSNHVHAYFWLEGDTVSRPRSKGLLRSVLIARTWLFAKCASASETNDKRGLVRRHPAVLPTAQQLQLDVLLLLSL